MKMPVPPGFSTRWHLANQLRGVGGVLHDAVAVDDVERRVGVRQRLAVGDAQFLGRHAVQLEILARKIDRRLRQVDAGDTSAALGEPHQVGADAAADFEQPLPPEAEKSTSRGR